MDVYLATTPYNLLNCINIKLLLYKDTDADILITNFTNANIAFAEKVKRANIFKNVYIINQKDCESLQGDYSVITKIYKLFERRFKNRFAYKKLFSQYCEQANPDAVYDRAFFDTPNYLQRLVFYTFLQNNKNLKYCRVDCGVESYYERTDMKIKMDWLRNPTKRILKKCDDYYLNSPNSFYLKNRTIHKIPNMDKQDKDYVNLINTIYEFKENAQFDREKIVYLDEIFSEMDLDSSQSKVVDYLYSSSERVAVKIHPRRENLSQYKDCTIYNLTVPYELLLLNSKENTDQKILVTPMSTAAALPKLLFDEEPYVICCYKAIGYSGVENDNVEKFFELLKSNYRQKNKVMMPSTMEELKANIDFVLSKNK